MHVLLIRRVRRVRNSFTCIVSGNNANNRSALFDRDLMEFPGEFIVCEMRVQQ